jgi:hypothetical protein
MKKQVGILSVIFAASALIPLTRAQNLIDATYGAGAGSFELGSYAGDAEKGFMRLPSGATNIVGWVLGNAAGGVDWMSQPICKAASGNYSMDLVGVLPGSGLSTTIPTTPGAVYKLSFQTYGPSQGTTGKVTAGSLSQVFDAPDGGPSATAIYKTNVFMFTANASSTTVTFEPVFTYGFGPAIDDVSVEPVAPRLAIRFSQVELSWNTISQTTYQVQYRSELTTNLWTDLGASIIGDGQNKIFTDAIAPGQPRRFYQVVTRP